MRYMVEFENVHDGSALALIGHLRGVGIECEAGSVIGMGAGRAIVLARFPRERESEVRLIPGVVEIYVDAEFEHFERL